MKTCSVLFMLFEFIFACSKWLICWNICKISPAACLMDTEFPRVWNLPGFCKSYSRRKEGFINLYLAYSMISLIILLTKLSRISWDMKQTKRCVSCMTARSWALTWWKPDKCKTLVSCLIKLSRMSLNGVTKVPTPTFRRRRRI